MDKQEQIEEMELVMQNSFGCRYSNTTDMILNNDRFFNREATALYNAGYRKIPEDSMVITKAEYQQMCHLLASACKLIGTLHKEDENG